MPNDGVDFQPLTVDEIRESGAFLPSLDGVTIWRKKLECDYCLTPFIETHMYLVQFKAQKIHLMCSACWTNWIDTQ